MDQHAAPDENNEPLSSKDKAAIKKNIFKHLQLPATPETIWNPGGIKSWVFRAVAAAVVLFLSVQAYFWLRPQKLRTPAIAAVQSEIRTGSGETKRFSLADGTSVVLNANSVLRYDKELAQNASRNVELEGNAFFFVARSQRQRPFVVSTTSLNITVLGTSLNVDARHVSASVQLTSGKLKVESKNMIQPAVYLQPGDRVTLDSGAARFAKDRIDTRLYEAWTRGRWNFTNTSLRQVAELMNEYYGTEMIFNDPRKADLRITALLPVTSSRSLTEIIENTLPVKIKTNDKQLIVL